MRVVQQAATLCRGQLTSSQQFILTDPAQRAAAAVAAQWRRARCHPSMANLCLLLLCLLQQSMTRPAQRCDPRGLAWRLPGCLLRRAGLG